MGSFSRVEYRLVQQEDSGSEGEEHTPLRRNLNHDKMNLSVHNRPLLLGSYLLVSLIGVTLVITTIVWTAVFKGGVSFTRTEQGISFNWHPILMTLSLIFLYGNGALIYRVIPPRNDAHKLKLKLAHAGIMIVAFALMVIGLQAAFDSHNKANPPKPNMYTLHSWIGLLAALLFGCQWALGFAAFLFPKFSPEIRALILPFHQYFGSAILALAVAAACMGHLEKMIWSNMAGYVAKDAEAQIVNTTGLFLVLFAMGVTFLLSKFSTDHKPGVASK